MYLGLRRFFSAHRGNAPTRRFLRAQAASRPVAPSLPQIRATGSRKRKKAARFLLPPVKDWIKA